MMKTEKKIVLVCIGEPDSSVTARYLSGILKSKGFETTIITITIADTFTNTITVSMISTIASTMITT